MSAANRGAVRRLQDNYQTPLPAIEALARELEPHRARIMTWAEPAAGDGNIISAFWRLLGVQPGAWRWAEIMEGRDYLADGIADHRGDGWGPATPYGLRGIVTNPPYLGDLPQRFVDRSLDEAPFVAYLLRQGFRGSQKRRDWWQGKEPTHLFTLAERPSFMDACTRKGCATTLPADVYSRCPKCGGTVRAAADAADYEWFVWDRVGLCLRRPGVYVV